MRRRSAQVALPGLAGPADVLAAEHYLGPLSRGKAYQDAAGVIVVSAPTSRRLPTSWLELARWCITDRARNAGSSQWARALRWIRATWPGATTVVSYSDPSVGHGGALYRACGWLWAPTWHRLAPPPTGCGSWDGVTVSAPKDRWVYVLAPDPGRVVALVDRDLARRWPAFAFTEPTWRRGTPHGGGGDFARWRAEQTARAA